MSQFKQKLHSELNETTVWGYEGTYPGPTFEVNRGECVHVTWKNNITSPQHLLPVDKPFMEHVIIQKFEQLSIFTVVQHHQKVTGTQKHGSQRILKVLVHYLSRKRINIQMINGQQPCGTTTMH